MPPAWDYDLIIIGAGPAGLPAGIYAGRARLKTLLQEKLTYGGQMTTDLGISGSDLSNRMRNQAERFGLKFRSQEALELQPGKPGHTVTSAHSRLTIGPRYRRLGAPGADKVIGRGADRHRRER
jgi:thioredoxin reductase (NADPH)